MQEITTARERVLKSIRNANLNVDKNIYKDIDHESNIYPEFKDENLIVFAESFNQHGGQFVYCASESELASNLLALIEKKGFSSILVKDNSLKQFCLHYKITFEDQIKKDSKQTASITLADHLLARTGSIAIRSNNGSGRGLHFTSECLIVIAYADQLRGTIQDSIKEFHAPKSSPSSFISYISGPSQTADIEKTLVKGMHGSQEVILFLLETN